MDSRTFVTGSTINTPLSKADYAAANGGNLHRHETWHTRQWAFLPGGLFPVAYQLEKWRTGADPCSNLFEITADLKDGGYTQCGC